MWHFIVTEGKLAPRSNLPSCSHIVQEQPVTISQYRTELLLSFCVTLRKDSASILMGFKDFFTL